LRLPGEEGVCSQSVAQIRFAAFDRFGSQPRYNSAGSGEALHIPLFHTLYQISWDEHIGSLAENLLEALRGHPEKIEEVRLPTKRGKKRPAMALQDNQLIFWLINK